MNQRKSARFALAAVAVLYSVAVRADCEGSQNLPSEQLHVAFELNDARISQLERQNLRGWVSQINSKYVIQNWITIVGSAASSERAAKQLAMRRAVTVAREALEDGLVDAPLQVKAQIYPADKSGSDSSEVREVTVEVSPGCPDNCCVGQ